MSDEYNLDRQKKFQRRKIIDEQNVRFCSFLTKEDAENRAKICLEHTMNYQDSISFAYQKSHAKPHLKLCLDGRYEFLGIICRAPGDYRQLIEYSVNINTKSRKN